MAGAETSISHNEIHVEAFVQMSAISATYGVKHEQTEQVRLSEHLEENSLLAHVLTSHHAFPQMAMLTRQPDDPNAFKPEKVDLLDLGEFPDGPQLKQHVLMKPTGELVTSPVYEGAMSNLTEDLQPAGVDIYIMVRDSIIPKISKALDAPRDTGENAGK